VPEFNRYRAAQVLVDATLTDDQAAAEKWGVTDRTVRDYRARLATDLELATVYRDLLNKAANALSRARRRFLEKALEKLEDLVEAASKPEHITAVAGAVKVVGELELAADVLNGADHRPEGPLPAAAPAAAEGSEDPEGVH